tara:strand:- start:15267 stop:15500 length:234 start_codon:yes stop_codon:yes gene_type:complete
MKQDNKFVLARDKVKKYIQLGAVLGNNSTRGKLSGGIFNGTANPDLTELDMERINEVVSETEQSLKEFKQELKRIGK